MYDACVLHLNKRGIKPQLLDNLEMIDFLERGEITQTLFINQNIYAAKRGGFCGVLGARLSVCKNLEEVFQGYVDQVKKSEVRDLEKEREKHGADYTPQSKTFRKGDAKIFDLNDKDSGVRENVFQDIAKNLIHQDDRFGNFEKKYYTWIATICMVFVYI